MNIENKLETMTVENVTDSQETIHANGNKISDNVKPLHVRDFYRMVTEFKGGAKELSKDISNNQEVWKACRKVHKRLVSKFHEQANAKLRAKINEGLNINSYREFTKSGGMAIYLNRKHEAKAKASKDKSSETLPENLVDGTTRFNAGKLRSRLDGMKMPALKEIARANGLKPSRKKSDTIETIVTKLAA